MADFYYNNAQADGDFNNARNWWSDAGHSAGIAGSIVDAATTNTSTTVTHPGLYHPIAGSVITGTGIPAATTVASITSATEFELSQAATASGTVTLECDIHPFPTDGDDVWLDAEVTTPPSGSWFLGSIRVGDNGGDNFGVDLTGATAPAGMIEFVGGISGVWNSSSSITGDGTIFSGDYSYNVGNITGDNTIFSGANANNSGTITGNGTDFSGDSASNSSTINGDGTDFSGVSSYNSGTINGNDMIFSGANAYNSGTIIGNGTTFSGVSSYNSNAITGDGTTFSGDYAYNNSGTINGSAIYFSSPAAYALANSGYTGNITETVSFPFGDILGTGLL